MSPLRSPAITRWRVSCSTISSRSLLVMPVIMSGGCAIISGGLNISQSFSLGTQSLPPKMSSPVTAFFMSSLVIVGIFCRSSSVLMSSGFIPASSNFLWWSVELL